jgi:tetratricopeptide (TPR) repeat protein
MEYRFWPDRERLPFMDGHLESGTRRDRTLYTYAHADRAAWLQLDRERKFDYLVLGLKLPTGFRLREFVEADDTWTLVFLDDAAAVFVRRAGPLAPVAGRHGYRLLRVGPGGLRALMTRCAADSVLRAAVAGEFERSIAESPYHASAHSMLAELALMESRRADARRHLEQALTSDPLFGTAHERIGLLDLREGKPDEALRRFELEYRLHPWPAGRDLRLGMVRQARGDIAGARAAYRRELAKNPGNQEARDSLAALGP